MALAGGSCLGVEQRIAQPLVVTHRGEKCLRGHLAIKQSRSVKGRHHILHWPVVVEDFLLNIPLLIRGVAPAETLFDRQVSVGIQVQSHGLVLGIHYCNLLDLLLRRNGLPFIEERHARFVQPLAQDNFDCKVAPSQVVRELLLLVHITHAPVSNFVPFVTAEDLDYIALLGKLKSVLVRILLETPKQCSQTVGLSVMEAVGTAFQSHILNGQIGLSAERLNSLIQNRSGLLGISLVGGDGGDGLRRSCITRGSRRLSLGKRKWCQQKDNEGIFHLFIYLDAENLAISCPTRNGFNRHPASTAPPFTLNTSPVIKLACGVQRKR